MYRYRIAGLTVASEIALPGALASAASGAPDVTMRQGQVPETLDDAVTATEAWDCNSAHILLRARGTGRFLTSHGSSVTFEPARDAADCAVYLLGSVFGFLLHQRGDIVLHASAIAVNGKAVLFCGRSGMGKSTLAAALAMRGYAILSDDFCAISFAAGGDPIVKADSRQLKLSAEAIDATALGARRGAPVQSRIDKYFVEPPRSAHLDALPLGAIYVLRREGPTSPVGIEPLAGAEALRVVCRNAYRPGFVRLTGQEPRYFKAAAAMARKAAISRLTPWRDLARLPQTVAWLERNWLESGLLQVRHGPEHDASSPAAEG